MKLEDVKTGMEVTWCCNDGVTRIGTVKDTMRTQYGMVARMDDMRLVRVDRLRAVEKLGAADVTLTNCTVVNKPLISAEELDWLTRVSIEERDRITSTAGNFIVWPSPQSLTLETFEEYDRRMRECFSEDGFKAPPEPPEPPDPLMLVAQVDRIGEGEGDPSTHWRAHFRDFDDVSTDAHRAFVVEIISLEAVAELPEHAVFKLLQAAQPSLPNGLVFHVDNNGDDSSESADCRYEWRGRPMRRGHLYKPPGHSYLEARIWVDVPEAEEGANACES